MPEYERKNNTATIFNNDYKETENQPDLKGEALVGDVKYYVSAWKRSDKNGNDYYSMSLQTFEEAEKYKKKKDSDVQEQTDKSDQSDSEDLPF